MTAAVVAAILQMFGLFAVGWLIRRTGYAGRTDFDKIARICTDFFFPALIFSSLVRDLDAARLREWWPLPLLGFGFMALGAISGWFLRRGLSSPRDPEVEKSFLHICAINNYGFLPIFIIEVARPGEMLALFFFFHLGSTVGFWTIGVLTLGGQRPPRETVRRLLTPSLISLFVAAGAALLGAKNWVPGWMMQVFQKTGALSVPLMIIAIGATVQGSLRHQQWWNLFYLSAIRIVLLPALLIGVVSILPLAPDVRLLCVIVALMPAAATAAVMTRLYGGDSEYAAAVTLVTTVASIGTVPVALRWLGL